MSREERADFLETLGLEEAGLDRLIRAGYQLLDQLGACNPAELDKWTAIMNTWSADHAEKVLSDALQGIVFVDDKWIWDLHKRRMEPDADGARIVLRVRPMVVAQRQGSLLEAA